MRDEAQAIFSFVVISALLMLLVGVCCYSRGYSTGVREQQRRDIDMGAIIIANQDDRIKQLESVLITNKIKIPK